MSLDIVLDSISTVKRDIDYIGTILQDHIPNRNDGRAMIATPFIQLEQSERDEVIEISKSIVTRIAEIDKILTDDSWRQGTQWPLEFSQQLYGTAIQSNNSQIPDDVSLFEPLGKLKESINRLETVIRISDAVSQGTKSKNYSETQIDAQINELEKKRRESRLKMYNKLDPDLKKLSQNLQKDNSNVLDKSVDKLLHLTGFDTEIYDPEIPGNIDVIALDRKNGIICILENTTGKISKSKVDQIVGRHQEYKKEYQSWKDSKIYPILVCNNDTVFVDNISKQNAVHNAIAVITKKDLDEIIKNVKKGKMSPTLFAEYIKKRIPKS